MVKRKVNYDQDSELDGGNSGSDAAPTKPKAKKNHARQASKAVQSEEEEDQVNSDDEPPLSKKSKSKKEDQKDVTSESDSNDVVIKSAPDGDKYIELGKRRRVTVRSFKGNPLIDLREFYEAAGGDKPGKKGISLTLEQWEVLKKSSSIIDKLLADLKKTD